MSATNGSVGSIIHEEKDTAKKILIDALVTLRDLTVVFVLAFLRLFLPVKCKSVRQEIVLVTGAGSGIGRELAVEFAKLGATVVLWDINKETNEGTHDVIRKVGGKSFPYCCDVGDRAEVYRVAALVKEEVGPVSILVNNAGIVTGKKLLDCSDDDITKTFQVNLLAQFWTVKCFLPSMMEKNHGHVVNIASSVGLIGLSRLVDYSSSKFGVVGFSEVLHYELASSGYDGVHTTVVCPSFVKTGMFQGCKMRFRWILPELETTQTVQHIMHGILTNKIQVCIPRIVYFFAFLKTFIPVEAMLVIQHFFGAVNFMDSFVGRKTKNK
ncbi:epidermal retinol dehydrogenase 2-like [Liolophura sinensis]|uniref:epidermal retinol dehydrogenase 2-like n=1 Tax=Liolophura sinensis TaxID=3198878 RepID=UPI003158634C